MPWVTACVYSESGPCSPGGCSPIREVSFKGEKITRTRPSQPDPHQRAVVLEADEGSAHVVPPGVELPAGAPRSVLWESQSMLSYEASLHQQLPHPSQGLGAFLQTVTQETQSFWGGNEASLLESHPCRASLPRVLNKTRSRNPLAFCWFLSQTLHLLHQSWVRENHDTSFFAWLPHPSFPPAPLLITHPGKKRRALHSFWLIDTSISYLRWHISCPFPWRHNDRQDAERKMWLN